MTKIILKKNILFIGILLLLTACENDIEMVNAMFSKEQVNVEEAREVQLLYSDSAKVRVRVFGPVMLRHIDHAQPKEEFPDGILVEFMQPGTERTNGQLTAKYAIRFENQGKIIVRDSVVWTSGKGEELRTSELTWDDQKKSMYTNRFVKITKPDEVFYGYGFEADQDFNHWKITNPTGKMMVEGLEGLGEQ